MSPKLRQAVHVAIDALLDAIEDERSVPVPATRARPVKVREMPPGVSEIVIERARQAGVKAGLL